MASLTGFLSNVNPGPFIKKGRGQSKMMIGIVIGLIVALGGFYFFFIRSGDSEMYQGYGTSGQTVRGRIGNPSPHFNREKI